MIINLLSSPRNISTALMYFFAHRGDVKVMDEPFYAYYLTESGAQHPGGDEVIASQPTRLSEVLSWIEKIASQHPVVFIKNMAHHLIGTDADFLDDYRNVFLIRDPKQLIASFAEVIPNPTMQDIGLKRQFELFEKLSQKQDCPVVDSGQVLTNPTQTLQSLCERLGLTFDPKMLHWTAGAIPEDGVWAGYWYKNVHRSTGFGKQSTSERPFPAHCRELLDEAIPYYQQLAEYAIGPTG